MADRITDNPLKIPPTNGANDSVGSKLQRETELLRDGLSLGVVNRLSHMYENPVETAATVAGCATVGAALNIANRAGGRWATAAKVATYGFTAALACDVVRRGVPTIGAMADTWSSANNLATNKETVAQHAGSALVDYPLMMAAGYGGFKAAGKIQAINVNIKFGELSKDFGIGPEVKPAAGSVSKVLEWKGLKLERFDATAFEPILSARPRFAPPIVPYDLLNRGSSEQISRLALPAPVQAGKDQRGAKGRLEAAKLEIKPLKY